MSIRLPASASELGHIFRKRPGHLQDTEANRRLLLEVAADPEARLESDQYDNLWAARTLEGGHQVWVQFRDDLIINGGQPAGQGLQPADRTEKTMKEQQAYDIMFRFLADRYKRLPSDALGGLLGDLHLLADGEPADPAIPEEWEEAIAAVRQQRDQSKVEPLRKAS